MALDFRHITVFLLAIIPAFIWLYLFLREHHENKWLVLLTFIGGMVAAKLILVYQGYWDTTINFIFFKVEPVDFAENIKMLFSNDPLLALFLSFVGVGVMEEFVKFWIMKFINHNFFKSINDVILLAIISSLGFAFFENILYFVNNWDSLSTGSFFAFVILRVTVVTMVHVLCSGILGYYYGMAFFSSPMLKIQRMKNKRHPILKFLKKVFRIKKSLVYHDEMLVIGLFSAMFLHAIYDFAFSININILGLPLHIPIMLLYFFGGFWYLMHLLKKKDHHLKLRLIGTRVMPKRDFAELLDKVQAIKKKMKNNNGATEQRSNKLN